MQKTTETINFFRTALAEHLISYPVIVVAFLPITGLLQLPGVNESTSPLTRKGTSYNWQSPKSEWMATIDTYPKSEMRDGAYCHEHALIFTWTEQVAQLSWEEYEFPEDSHYLDRLAQGWITYWVGRDSQTSIPLSGWGNLTKNDLSFISNAAYQFLNNQTES